MEVQGTLEKMDPRVQIEIRDLAVIQGLLDSKKMKYSRTSGSTLIQMNEETLKKRKSLNWTMRCVQSKLDICTLGRV